MKKSIFVTLVILFALVSSAVAQESREARTLYIPFQPPPPALVQYVPGQIVVIFKVDLKETSISRETEAVITGYPSLDKLNERFEVYSMVPEFPTAKARSLQPEVPELSRYYILKFNGKNGLKEVMKAYAENPWVEHVEPIGIHPVYESIPDDPYFLSDQWNLYDSDDHDVDATDAWDLETGDTGILLGDLDTGLQYNSRDLGGLSPYTQGNVWINWPEYEGEKGVDDDGNGYVDDWVGWDWVDDAWNPWPGEDGDDPDNEPTDFNGHGTHVAGIMGAITNNGIMVAGLAGGWNTSPSDPANGVKIMALRIGWSAPHPISGEEVGYVRMDFAAQAIYYATNKGVTAVNCSWGSSNTGGLGAAVDYATANGVLVIAAAGNDGDSNPDYLGTRPDVLNVCATNSNDVKPWWSDYGIWVDVAAPGVDVISTYSSHYDPNWLAWISGTSQAAPHATGEAGLLKSYADTLTRQQIFDLIVDYTDDIDPLNPGYEGLLGSGRINCFKALDAVVSPSVTVIQPNGGEVLYIGQVYTIIWEAEDNVGIDSTTIHYSVDGGQTWMHIVDLEGNPESYDWTVTGPPSSECRVKVTCCDAVGRCGSDISDEDFCPPYKIVARGFTIASESTLPKEFGLSQNRPNPFNATTAISYQVSGVGSQRSAVSLKIYNLLGQEVKTLVDGKQAPGYYSVAWDGRDSLSKEVASGIYFYRIKAGDFTATRKMALLK